MLSALQTLLRWKLVRNAGCCVHIPQVHARAATSAPQDDCLPCCLASPGTCIVLLDHVTTPWLGHTAYLGCICHPQTACYAWLCCCSGRVVSLATSDTHLYAGDCSSTVKVCLHMLPAALPKAMQDPKLNVCMQPRLGTGLGTCPSTTYGKTADAPCTMHYALCTMQHALCDMRHATCTMHHAPYASMPFMPFMTL